MLESQDHQCPQRAAEEGSAEGGRAAEGDAVRGDTDRMRAAAGRIRADVPEDGGKRGRHAAAGLGRMVTFYAFPQEHWRHLRTTNIVESPFASVRLRTDASRRYKRVEGAQAIIWKMLQVAEKSWRKQNALELLPLVVSGVTFKDGVMTESGGLESALNHQPERTAA